MSFRKKIFYLRDRKKAEFCVASANPLGSEIAPNVTTLELIRLFWMGVWWGDELVSQILCLVSAAVGFSGMVSTEWEKTYGTSTLSSSILDIWPGQNQSHFVL